MLLKSKLIKFASNAIVAPHGITDIVHADQLKLLEPLVGINLLSVGSFELLNYFHFNNISNFLFFFFSAIHFQHDVPFKNFYVRFGSIGLLFILSAFYNDILFYYLLLIHVPNHYKTNLSYLKNSPLKSMLVLSLSTFVCVSLDNLIVYNQYNGILQGIIVGHIIYEELFLRLINSLLKSFFDNT